MKQWAKGVVTYEICGIGKDYLWSMWQREGLLMKHVAKRKITYEACGKGKGYLWSMWQREGLLMKHVAKGRFTYEACGKGMGQREGLLMKYLANGRATYEICGKGKGYTYETWSVKGRWHGIKSTPVVGHIYTSYTLIWRYIDYYHITSTSALITSSGTLSAALARNIAHITTAVALHSWTVKLSTLAIQQYQTTKVNCTVVAIQQHQTTTVNYTVVATQQHQTTTVNYTV